MSKHERKADHQSAAMLIGLASLPVMSAFIGAFVLLQSHPIVSVVLGLLGGFGWVRVIQFAGKLGEKNARKHLGVDQ